MHKKIILSGFSPLAEDQPFQLSFSVKSFLSHTETPLYLIPLLRDCGIEMVLLVLKISTSYSSCKKHMTISVINAGTFIPSFSIQHVMPVTCTLC
jgi:hypothetical protein